MNPETIQDTIPHSTVLIDTSAPQQHDSSNLTIDSLVLFKETNSPKRFITEKNIFNKTQTSSSKANVPEWITILLIGGFILLAILNFMHRKNLFQIFDSMLSQKHANLVVRDGSFLRKRFAFLLAFVYLISIPLLFYAIAENYLQIEVSNKIFIYLGLVVLFMGIFTYKVIFIQLVATLFETKKSSYDLIINILIFNLSLAVLILPFITLFIYTQFVMFLYISMGVYLIGITLRLFREVQVGLSKSIFSNLHLFLYLCTLEFIPTAIIYKAMIIYYL